MKKRRRLLGILFILLAIIVTQIPVTNVSARSSSELDFKMDRDTLAKYTGTATTVSVLDDVKFIGEEAFANNQYVGILNVNRNTKIIKHGAFANCTYLQKVSGLQNVEIIESAAFSGCQNLTSIAFGNQLRELGDGVFAGCINLSNISVPKDNHNFSVINGALYDNTKQKLYAYAGGNTYKSYIMPDSVKNISMYSFWGNEDLEDVVLSSNLEKIPGYAFANCKDLKVINIPYSVDSIDAKAFENCVSLGRVEIPPTVKYIDPTAFDGCAKLEIIAEPGTVAYDFYQRFDRSDVRNVETQDAKEIINNIDNLKTESVSSDSSDNAGESSTVSKNGYIDASKDPSNVEWMPSVNSFITEDDPSILGKTIVVSGRAVLFINKEMNVSELTKTVNEDLDDSSLDGTDSSGTGDIIYDSGKGGYLPKYTETDSKVASWAYYGDKELDNYNVKAGIDTIGRFSFARSGLKSINIPDGVKSIEYGAFYHCDNLNDITIPQSVEKIDAYALANTPYMNKFMSDVTGNKFLILGDGILVAYSGNDANVNIPDGVKTIAATAFMNNDSVAGVTIPSSCINIESDAFRDCSNLSTVEGAENVVHIGDRAFMGCPIGTFVVGSKVDSMGLRSVDYSNVSKADTSKVVVFEGNVLPVISYDETTARLSNNDYRQNVLYNVLFAVVNENVNSFENTVLDGNKLGFSGLILSIDKDENGYETGFVNIKKNYIFSDDILNQLPDSIAIKGKTYTIKDKDTLNVASKDAVSSATKDILVYLNGNATNIKAKMSESEALGRLEINSDSKASELLKNAYDELFGSNDIEITGYDISLYDITNTVKVDKFGKSTLEITMPINEKYNFYHVVALDEDGQLEELPAFYNEDNKCLSFKCSHLSYIGIYGTDNDNSVLSVKEGKLIKNSRLDDSPNTGDYSISIKYVISILLLSIGLILLLKKNKIRTHTDK